MTESGSIRPDWWKRVVSNYLKKKKANNNDNAEKKDCDSDSDSDEEDDVFNVIDTGNKLLLLLDIINQCGTIGDKL